MKCPFCQYEIPSGATVCGHCGAFSKPMAVIRGGFAFRLLAVFIVIAAGPITFLYFVVPDALFAWGTTAVIASPLVGLAVGVAMMSRLPKEPKWFHRH